MPTRRMTQTALIFLISASLSGCLRTSSLYTVEQPIPPKEFSHAAFDHVLRDHVREGVVDYPGILFDVRFDDYTQQLAQVESETLPTRADRLAFWINAYNAMAIRTVLEGELPVGWYGKYRFFDAREHRVGGFWTNLEDLEEKRLTAEFHEPRITFAIVDASRSAPNLASHAYRAETLDEDLDRAAREFINDPTKNRFDRVESTAYLSRIFKWHRKEFESQGESLLRYIARYVDDPELARLLKTKPFTIRFLPYDRGLNGPPVRQAGPSLKKSQESW